MPYEERLRLLEALLTDFFVTQRAILLKWAGLTGQSAQIDTGYIAQHVASILLTEPGQGFKGKGLDLADGSEVKSAAILSGVDRPRWNHNLGRPADDKRRLGKGLRPQWEAYLRAPTVFYLLFDRVRKEVGKEAGATELRVRAWCIDAQQDAPWRSLIMRFIEQRKPSQYNLQLHPLGYDDSIVVNTLGNLDMAEIQVLDVRVSGFASPEESVEVRWLHTPPADIRPIAGRTRGLPYGGRTARPSRLSTVADVLPDLKDLQRLVPTIDINDLSMAISTEAQAELEFEQDELTSDESET